MKAASIKQIKDEISNLSAEELSLIIHRLARFKAENKELLTYLLFEKQDEEGYVQLICGEIENMFSELNHQTVYILKKQLRKIVRYITRCIRFSDEKETEVRIRLAFCKAIQSSGIQIKKHVQIRNIYEGQLKLAKKVLATMHEDLQYDYLQQLKSL